MRIVDLDALLETLSKYYPEYWDEVIEKLPTIDAVPVVRCKDCKWYQDGELFSPKKFCFRLKDRDGKRVGYNFDYEDFCSYGERRNGADDETV